MKEVKQANLYWIKEAQFSSDVGWPEFSKIQTAVYLTKVSVSTLDMLTFALKDSDLSMTDQDCGTFSTTQVAPKI